MKLSIFVSVAVAATVAAGAVSAQTQPSNPGPVVPGVCLYNHDRLLAQSAVGTAVSARLQQLAEAVRAELQPEGAAIQAEAAALQPIAADQRVDRTQALALRLQTYQALEQQRGMELAYTQQVQEQQIATSVEPILSQVYVERGCGILFQAGAVHYANPQMDVTDRVIEILNGQLQTLTFDRMPLPQQQ